MKTNPGTPRSEPIDQPRKKGELTYAKAARELQENEALQAGRLFRFDTFSQTPVLMKWIPRRGAAQPSSFEPRPVEDVDITHLCEWFEVTGYKKANKNLVFDAVIAEAKRNCFSWPRDVLEALDPWDGVRLMDDFLIMTVNPEISENDPEQIYVKAMTRCLFISIVARVMEPGCQADNVLLLKGAQGISKSSLMRLLAIRPEWFSDDLPSDLTLARTKQCMRGKLIIEMSEAVHFKRSSAETQKAFLSTRSDYYIPQYGRFPKENPRQCVFVSTTNNMTVSKDNTGNRRLWPVMCTGTIDLALAETLMPRIMAEALAAYRHGEQWHLPPEIEALANIEQEAIRAADDPWKVIIEDYVNTMTSDQKDGRRFVEIKQFFLSGFLDIPPGKRTSQDTQRIADILDDLGGKKGRETTGYRRRGYFFPAAEEG